MAQIIDLRDLLKHEILDLFSAEEQIIEALPKMIEKAGNAELKKALRDHLKITQEQKSRLDEIKGLMGEEKDGNGSEKKNGFFSKLFGGSGTEKCKGTEGLIKEGEKMMGEDMSTEVMDAAIIGAAQKIEHYEISGYGTALAYARELRLSNVAGLLKQTLDEEYAADDALTELAVGKLNVEAENAGSSKNNRRSSSVSKGNASKNSSLNVGGKKGSSYFAGNGSSKGVSKGNSLKGNSSNGSSSKSAKSSGNKSVSKSVSKTTGKSGEKSSSKSNGKSGNAQLKRR
jgi:ferritin-like metal-binding protein YciE